MSIASGLAARQRIAGLPDLLGALARLMGCQEPEVEVRRLISAAAQLCQAETGLMVLRLPPDATQPCLFLAGPGAPPSLSRPSQPVEKLLEERFRGRLAIWNEGFELWPGQRVRAFLCAPVRSGSEDYGLLGLANKRGGFDSGDLEFAAQLASCAASCLASALWRERSERATTYLEVLCRLCRQLLAELRPEPVIDAAKELIGASLGMIAVFDTEAHLILRFGDFSAECGVDSRLDCPRFVDKYLSPSPVIDNDLGSRNFLPEGHPAVSNALTVRLPVGPQHSACLMLANKPAGFSRHDGRTLETLVPYALLALLGEDTPGLGSSQGPADAWARYEALRHLSHDLKTPLAGLALCHDLLVSERLGPLTPRQRRALESGGRNLERLRADCARLIDLACLRCWRPAADRRRVDLASLVREAVAAIKPLAAQQRLGLEADLPESLRLQGDAERLRQLVDNLLSNAVKFNRPGGRIELRLSADTGAARLEVSDTGLGIGEDERGRVFDRFFRGRSATRCGAAGQGLGLSIVREIVEMHGGSLSLESTPGVGTTFSVTLPSSPPEDGRPG